MGRGARNRPNSSPSKLMDGYAEAGSEECGIARRPAKPGRFCRRPGDTGDEIQRTSGMRMVRSYTRGGNWPNAVRGRFRRTAGEEIVRQDATSAYGHGGFNPIDPSCRIVPQAELRARSGTFSSIPGLLLHAIVHADDIQDRDCGILVIFADGGYQGPKFNQALARVLPYLKAEKAFRLGQGICGLAQTLDRRAYVRLAQSVPQARQGLGKPHSQGAGVLAPHLNPPPERSIGSYRSA